MPSADRFLTVHRDPHSAEVLARGGGSEAHSVLERAGFVPVVRLDETYHRAPTGLAPDTENQLATEAVARLRAAGYHVGCDEDFNTGRRPARYPTLGSSVAHLAEHLREATTTEDAADALTELTAPYDGVLAAIEQVLYAAADFHDGLGAAADPYTARRLRHLADRHTPHPRRSTCAGEVPAGERERSAVCACPPPPCTAPVRPPPAVAAGLRR
ncbi:hypothetical protein [Streptomyces sp. GQFP]|uniref:hypothetical protein n=1 Tax=Streptomyces sp. GQFP TaxID=2907545 RepID=UPI001F3B8C90|nr:hypothetical protein [Streptomyces sp. GQFP]UIX34375.1 hypothetical protein LUX31_32640 [Streptomyces sp. GQFP]